MNNKKELKARWFSEVYEGNFVSRPNRFVGLVDLNGLTIRCHCPNPGRMSEFLFPGAKVFFSAANTESEVNETVPAYTKSQTDAKEGRAKKKTQGRLEAVIHKPLDSSESPEDQVVPLRAGQANDIAEYYIIPLLFPEYRSYRREYSLGSSRFDFFVCDTDGKDHLIEIKACTEVEYGTAMFPDAPSQRATKHVQELQELSQKAYECHVVFIVNHGKAKALIPNLHTDPEFAQAVKTASNKVDFRAALFHCDEEGFVSFSDPEQPWIPVITKSKLLEETNKGNYFLVFYINEACSVDVGALGRLNFDEGWYAYCGSAQKNLKQRISRHLAKRGKKLHWHIDYLLPFAETIKAFPVISAYNKECEMAASLARLGAVAIPRFGSSDCGCASHLLKLAWTPGWGREFMQVLMALRHKPEDHF